MAELIETIRALASQLGFRGWLSALTFVCGTSLILLTCRTLLTRRPTVKEVALSIVAGFATVYIYSFYLLDVYGYYPSQGRLPRPLPSVPTVIAYLIILYLFFRLTRPNRQSGEERAGKYLFFAIIAALLGSPGWTAICIMCYWASDKNPEADASEGTGIPGDGILKASTGGGID